MARNEEKHAGRLNRLWLQQLDEERLKKNPIRPGLGSLKTSADIKKWIPSIKKDIEFYLKQSQVGCYPERKISEFTSKIESLTKEYKAYLRKYRELEGSTADVPWTDKPYTRKHKLPKDIIEDSSEVPTEEESCTQKQSRLSVPILELEDSYNDLYGYKMINEASKCSILSNDIVSPVKGQAELTSISKEKQITQTNDLDDKPLHFNVVKIDRYRSLKGNRGINDLCVSNDSNTPVTQCTCDHTVVPVMSLCNFCEKSPTVDTNGDKVTKSQVSYSQRANLLNIPYSDSSESEGEG
ncbi:hypothetical protein ACF0H5_005418 [Mactra antiquata]